MTEKAVLGWAVVPGYDGQHAVPVQDLRVHVVSADCWCKPVDKAEGDLDFEGSYWAHNSMDRREHTIEQGIVQ